MPPHNPIAFGLGPNLAVDDGVRRLAVQEGFQFIGADAAEVVAGGRPAVVLLEHPLDGVDSLALLRQLRADHPDGEVVFITQDGTMDTAIEALRAGALDYIKRPLDFDELRVALRRARERLQQRNLGGPPRILVIEDHEPTRERLLHILRKEGYECEGACNGAEGLEILSTSRFNVLFVDVRMPIKGGLEVLREVKEQNSDAEVIVTTGYGDEELVVKCLRSGAANFLRKPIDIDHMLVAIEKALDLQNTRLRLMSRNRDVELMQELVVRITRKLEIAIDTPAQLGGETRRFLQELLDALPIGIVVADAEQHTVFANQHVTARLGEVPPMLAPQWLAKLGVQTLAKDTLDATFARVLNERPGAVETVDCSQWSFIAMTPLKLLRTQPSLGAPAAAADDPAGLEHAPKVDATDKYVVLVVRGERGPHDGE